MAEPTGYGRDHQLQSKLISTIRATRGVRIDSPVRNTSWHTGRPWSPAELEQLLNLAATQTVPTIARQLRRTEKSVRRKLEQLGRTQDMLTGFKTKDLANDLQVSIRRVRRWRAKGYLECVSGRITEESFEKFCRNHSDKIPYRRLGREMQVWLDSFGYQTDDGYRIAELATMLRVSPKTVKRWVAMNWLQERHRRIPEDSVARLCRLHPEVIRLEELSIETRMILERLGFQVSQDEVGRDAREYSTLVSSECA